MVDLGVDALRRIATARSRDQCDARAVVVRGCSLRGLELREHDQLVSKDVELGIHGAGGLLASAERNTSVGLVQHAVGKERAKHGILRRSVTDNGWI